VSQDDDGAMLDRQLSEGSLQLVAMAHGGVVVARIAALELDLANISADAASPAPLVITRSDKDTILQASKRSTSRNERRSRQIRISAS